jgi:adenylate kinase
MCGFKKKRYKSILLFGSPGSGKGTQGQILHRIPGLHHLSSGEVFRNLHPESENGELFHSLAGHGNLVPDDVTVRIVRDDIQARIEQQLFDPDQELLLLDGIPRSPNQAELMEDELDVIKIILLNIHDQREIVRRLKTRAHEQQRKDDAREDVIMRRLEVYHRETKPVLDCYSPDKMIDIDAGLSPISVLCRIVQAIEPVMNNVLCSARKM